MKEMIKNESHICGLCDSQLPNLIVGDDRGQVKEQRSLEVITTKR